MSDKDESNFDELLKSLQETADENATLAKALPAENPEDDDENIEAAAEEGEAAADENEGEDEAEGEEKPMAKSMTIDGEEVEVVDATEILKSLNGRLDATDSVLAKALQTTVAALQDQQKLIKSLGDKVEKLSGQGRGRKTVLTVHEKTSSQDVLAKSQADTQPSGEQILAKALNAQKEGKLSGHDVSRVEGHLNNGLAVPADILQRLS